MRLFRGARAGGRWLGFGALALAASGAVPRPAAAEALSFEDHARRVAPAVVLVRAVVSVRIALGDRAQSDEMEIEQRGVVVHPSGLVLVNNTKFGDESSALLRKLSEALGGVSISLEMSRIRVQVADETRERDAVLVVRDPKNDLAWIQVLDAKASPLAHVDLEDAVEPRLGQRLVGVTRRSPHFDHAAVVARCYVASRVTTPRLLWSLAGEFREAGHLVFDLEGRPAGVFVVQAAADDEAVDILLMPIDVVRKSRDAALPKAAEVLAAPR